MKLYFQTWKKSFTFQGRASRREVWLFIILNLIVAFILGFISGIRGDDSVVLGKIFISLLILPSISVWIRRIHDTGFKGWWFLLPMGNFIFLVIKGNSQTNLFGPSPKTIDSQKQHSKSGCVAKNISG